MYDELIEQLKSRASWLEFAIIATPSKADGNGDAILFRKAADAIEDLITALTASNEVIAKSKPKWIPVTERLPERCNFCLVADFGDVCEAYYNSDGVWFSQGNKLKGVTHWMPLPQPPKEG